MSAEARLKELGIELPMAPKPMGVYKPIIVVGGMAYLSGHADVRMASINSQPSLTVAVSYSAMSSGTMLALRHEAPWEPMPCPAPLR
jgi:hypothetical protein